MYLASNPYLPKYKVRAGVVLRDGDAFDGHVFVSGGQRISDLLRVGNAFLAFETLNGAFHLFNRKTILRVIPKESESADERPYETLTRPSASNFDGRTASELDAAERDAVMQEFRDHSSRRAENSIAGPAPTFGASDSAGAIGRGMFQLGRLSMASISTASSHLAGLHAKRARRRLRSAAARRHAGRYTTAALLLLAGLALTLTAAPLFIAEPTPQQRQADYGQGMRAYSRGDYATAVPVFEELAAQGMTQAQYRLGVMYSQGEGVPRDYGEAMAWHRRAAEKGHAQAQTAIGFIYRNGLGVRQDYKLAYMWFALGASGGDPDAVSRREEVAQKMSYDEIADAERRVQDWQSHHGAAR